MKFRHLLCGSALFALFCASAVAQEDPEAVYARMHRALLAGKTDEVVSYATAAQRAELDRMPKEQKEAVIGFMSKMLPATYTITEMTIAPDGNSAILRGTGVIDFMGKADHYLLANFKKEGGVWKVEKSSWSNNKPPAAAAKPAVPAAAPPQAVKTPNDAGLPAIAAPAKPQVAPAPVAVASKPSRGHLDARECLKQPTDKAIMACAEKYR